MVRPKPELRKKRVGGTSRFAATFPALPLRTDFPPRIRSTSPVRSRVRFLFKRRDLKGRIGRRSSHGVLGSRLKTGRRDGVSPVTEPRSVDDVTGEVQTEPKLVFFFRSKGDHTERSNVSTTILVMDEQQNGLLLAEAVFGSGQKHLKEASEALKKHGGNANAAAAELLAGIGAWNSPKRSKQTKLCFGGSNKESKNDERDPKREGESRLVNCPQCGRSVPLLTINVHLDTCCLTVPKSKKRRTVPVQHTVEGDHGCKTLDGHHLFLDFITKQEEDDLVSWISSCSPSWKTMRINGRHNGKKWGHFVNLRDRKVTLGDGPLPSPLLDLVKRMRQSIPFLELFMATDANAIEYIPNQGHELLPHVDDRQLTKDTLVNLSLEGDCIMTFQKEGTSNDEFRREVLLPRRSLQVLQRDARYTYTHSIKNEHLLSPRRISVTFRDSPVTEHPASKTKDSGHTVP